MKIRNKLILLSAVVLLLLATFLPLATIAVRYFLASNNELRYLEMQDQLYFTVLRCASIYDNRYNMLPLTVTDMTNMTEWSQSLCMDDQRCRKALTDAYYICVSNRYEFGRLYHKSSNRVEVHASIIPGNDFTDIVLSVNCLSANDLLQTGFSGVVVHGKVQLFAN